MNTKLILQFLSELSKNNNKEWFDKHKSDYEIVKKEYSEIVDEFIMRLAKFDSSVGDLVAKQCIFRLNRDVRFSNDKTPYKDWLGAYIIKGGRKNWKAGYYVHLQPKNSFIAAGLHIPKPEWLAAARQAISERGNELFKLTNASKFKSIWGDFLGEKLKKAPRDFDPNDKYIELIKLKSFDVIHNYKDKQILNVDEFISDAITKFKIIKPVNDFFNNAIK